MSDYLVMYLDTIDERLLEYLDEDEELRLDVVQRLRLYTSALHEGWITPDHVMEDWPDWYPLVRGFVTAYGMAMLKVMEDEAMFLDAVEEQDDVRLTEADLDYLEMLEAFLDMYPEMWTTEE